MNEEHQKQAEAEQLYLLTENDQIRESGSYPDQSVPSWAIDEVLPRMMQVSATLHIYEGYHKPAWIQALEHNTPERMVWSTFRTMETQIDGEWYVNNWQMYYIRDWTSEELVERKFNWEWLQSKMESDSTDIVERDGSRYKALYIGRVMDIAPSGKYYTAFTTNQTEEDQKKDAAFFEALDLKLQGLGWWSESDEGDPTDVFFCKNVEEVIECPTCNTSSPISEWNKNTTEIVRGLTSDDEVITPIEERSEGALFRCPNCQDEVITDEDGDLITQSGDGDDFPLSLEYPDEDLRDLSGDE